MREVFSSSIRIIKKLNTFSVVLLLFCSSCNLKTAENKKQLKEAIESSDLDKITFIIKNNPSLLNAKMTSLNPLEYCIIKDYYASFSKLIDLGADVNYIGNDKESILLKSVHSYRKLDDWVFKLDYMNKLLEKGADPNYTIKKGFTNENGGYIPPISVICKASTADVDMVKLLIKHGANYKTCVNRMTPLAYAIKSENYEVIDYYIDELQIDLDKPVANFEASAFQEKKVYYAKEYVDKSIYATKESPNYTQKMQLMAKIDSLTAN